MFGDFFSFCRAGFVLAIKRKKKKKNFWGVFRVAVMFLDVLRCGCKGITDFARFFSILQLLWYWLLMGPSAEQMRENSAFTDGLTVYLRV